MKTFYLKTKITEEVLKKVDCQSIEEAIEYFSKVKRLSKKDLVDIFLITKCEK